jgi:hypothetical protein
LCCAVVIFSLSRASASNYTLSANELNALQTLYYSTNGPNWLWRNTSVYGRIWNFSNPSTNPCDHWQGISCNSSCSEITGCHITGIALASYGIQGEIPINISDLEKIKTIDMEDNMLTGTFPQGVSQIATLEVLNLGSNLLRGSLPSAFMWTNLQSFNLSYNFFNDTIPCSFSTLNSLETFLVQNNLFAGSLPATGSIPWEGIKSFNIAHNKFSGNVTKVFAKVTKLTHLDLSNNYLTGSLPNSIGSCPLVYINVSTNHLYGNVESLLSQWTTLQSIDFSANSFQGTLPSSLSLNSLLQSMNFEDNQFSGSLPWSFGRLTNLRYLSVSQNSLWGRLPASIFNISSLVTANLEKNRFNESLPYFIRLPNLRNLYLQNNMLGGILSENLCTSKSLNNLNVHTNYFEGTIPSCFCQFQELRYLSLSTNGFKGSLPSCIGEMTSLTRIIAFQNQFSGPIPTSIGNLTRLVTFNMAENSLNGTIPSSIGSLVLLEVLVAFSNYLNGTIPETIGNLSSITYLDICNNSLSGSIPPSISKLSNSLLQLNLSENSLTGSIPNEIGDLVLLEGLILYANKLYGTIPPSVGRLQSLTYLDLGQNNFHGVIPDAVIQLEYLQTLYLNLNQFSGPIPAAFANLTLLTWVSLADNQLSGTIPSVLFHGNIDHIELSNNQLMGDLDDMFGGKCVSYVALNSNLLTGKPFEAVNCSSKSAAVTFINVSTNLLSGTLSDEVNLFSSVNGFDISSNFFSGKLPTGGFYGMNDITTLRINGNLFYGKLDSLFVNSSRPYLILDINKNSFSGSIPTGVLARGNVQSFTASLNCFTGSLPVELCANKILNCLLMDGLHSSQTCIQKVVPMSSTSGYVTPKSVHGSIPSCILSLPAMQNLHLAGNMLSGTISNELSPALEYLDLSFNVLTGIIPDEIWTKNFTTLSLANNRLGGTIPNFVTNHYSRPGTSIAVDVNRLSGSIPTNLLDAEEISVLNGNMFSCGDTLIGSISALPKNDPMVDTYECGSDYTDGSLLATFVAFIVSISTAAFLMLVIYGMRRLYSKYQKYMQFYSKQTDLSPIIGPKNYIRHYKNTCDRFVFLTTILSAFMLVVGMPLYGVLSIYYSTYKNSYIWAVSLAYLHGYTPAIVSLVFLTCVLEAVLLITSNHSFIKQRHLVLMAYQTTMRQLQALAEFRDSTTEMFRRSSMVGAPPGIASRNTIVTNRDTAEHLTNSVKDRQSVPHNTSDGRNRSSTQTVNPRPHSAAFSISASHSISTNISIDKRRLEQRAAAISKAKQHRQYWWTFLLYFGFTLVNLVVMFSVFSSYVSISQNGLTTVDQLGLSFAICLFKLFWGNVVINEVLSKLGFIWLDIEVKSSFKVVVLLFNVIVAPYIIIGAIDSNCFGTAIVQPPPIVSSAKGATCFLLGYNSFVSINANVSYITTSTVFSCAESQKIPTNMTVIAEYTSTNPIDFSPPFIYNFQCSSSLLSNFIFVQIIRFAMSGICVPWIFYMMKKFQVFLLHQYSVDSLFFWAFTKVMPVLHRPMEISEILGGNDVYHSLPDGPEKEKRYEELRAQLITVNGRIVTDMLKQPILTPQTLRIRMVVDLAMLLAFGVLFPPLTIVVFWSLFMDISMSEFIIGRLLSIYEEIGSSDECPMQELLEVTNMKLADFEEKLLRGISLSATASAAFWSLVLFDMLGDIAGANNAYWIILAMCFAPYWLHGLNRLVRYLYLRDLRKKGQNNSAKEKQRNESQAATESSLATSGNPDEDEMEITEEEQEMAKKRARELLQKRLRTEEGNMHKKSKDKDIEGGASITGNDASISLNIDDSLRNVSSDAPSNRRWVQMVTFSLSRFGFGNNSQSSSNSSNPAGDRSTETTMMQNPLHRTLPPTSK